MQMSRPRRRASSTPGLGGGHRVAGLAEHRHADALAQGAQLLDGGRTLEVGAHQQRVAALLAEPAGELGGVGGLAGPLQAGHQHHGGRPGGVLEPDRLAAERLDQRVVDQLDDLLGRVERLVDAGADRPLPDALEHRLDDDEVDVGLEEGQADLAQDLVDVGLPQRPLAAQPGEDALEAFGQRLEHEGTSLPAQDDGEPVQAADVAVGGYPPSALPTTKRLSMSATPGTDAAARSMSALPVAWGAPPVRIALPATTSTSGWGRCQVRGECDSS